MSFVVVLSTREQYEVVLHSGVDLSRVTVYCDNEHLYAFLEEKGIRYTELDEFSVRDYWSEINKWACEKAAGQIKKSIDNKIFQGLNPLPIIYFHFSGVLIQMAKSYRYSRFLIERHAGSTFIVFDSGQKKDYPLLNSNILLNEVIGSVCQSKGENIMRLSADMALHDHVNDAPKPLGVASLKAGLKNIIGCVYGALIKAPKKPFFMVYGSLTILSQAAAELFRLKQPVYLYNDKFQFKQFIFSIKSKIPYLVAASFAEKKDFDRQAFKEDFLQRVGHWFKSSFAANNYIYDGFDFKPAIDKYVVSCMDAYADRLTCEAAHYSAVIESCKIRGVLVDEDFDGKSFFSEFMKSKGVPLYCCSHANTVRDFHASRTECGFGQSITFVHSEHEKLMYVAKGWDPEKIVVVGSPRYDRLALMAKDVSLARNAQTTRFLYPASFFWLYSPDMWRYLGSEVFYYRILQEKAVRAILVSMRTIGGELVFKPHYKEGEQACRDMIARYAEGVCVRVPDASEDFVRLLSDSDALVLSYWSTTMIEAAILGVPIIYVDLFFQNSAAVKEYAKAGFCEYVDTPEALLAALTNIKNTRSGRRRKSVIAPDVMQYFLGVNDGRGAERVARHIVSRQETGEVPIA